MPNGELQERFPVPHQKTCLNQVIASFAIVIVLVVAIFSLLHLTVDSPGILVVAGGWAMAIVQLSILIGFRLEQWIEPEKKLLVRTGCWFGRPLYHREYDLERFHVALGRRPMPRRPRSWIYVVSLEGKGDHTIFEEDVRLKEALQVAARLAKRLKKDLRDSSKGGLWVIENAELDRYLQERSAAQDSDHPA